jgi:hypothetical protein
VARSDINFIAPRAGVRVTAFCLRGVNFDHTDGRQSALTTYTVK